MSQGLFTSKDSLDILVSYAVAEEGTNTLYLRLIDKMVRRGNVSDDYTMVEVEMILNYFPHAIWKTESELQQMKEAFYYPIVVKIKENVEKTSNR